MYQPQGRTDQSSYDYTDEPRELAMRFTRAQLEEALHDQNEAGGCMLKFDYEEYVPAEAIEEALRS